MFTNYPDNYQSLFNELIYSYSAEQEGDITLFITDSTGDNTLGVKKFYSASTAEINVAPIIRGLALPSYSSQEIGFIDAQGALVLLLNDGDLVESDERIFTYSKSREESLGVMTTLPTAARAISIGEREILSMRVDPELPTTIVVSHYLVGEQSAVASESYSSEATECGVVRFAFEALQPDVEGELERIEVVAYQDDLEVAQVEYCVIDPPVESLRVAWVSSRGSIEHYTFPAIVTTKVSSEGSRSVELNSAFECYDIRSALVEIVESPKVWVVDEQGIYEGEVEGDVIALSPRSELSAINLTITY